MVAVGQPGSKIVFTGQGTTGTWGGIIFDNTKYAAHSRSGSTLTHTNPGVGSELRHCVVERVVAKGGLQLKRGAPFIADCTVRDCSEHGIYVFIKDNAVTRVTPPLLHPAKPAVPGRPQHIPT